MSEVSVEIFSGVLDKIRSSAQPYEIAALELELALMDGISESDNRKINLVRHLGGLVSVIQSHDLTDDEKDALHGTAAKRMDLICAVNGIHLDDVVQSHIDGDDMVVTVKGDQTNKIH